MNFGDHQTFLEAYNAPHTIQDVQFDAPATLDACMPGSGIDDVQIEIASDVHQEFTGQQGFLVSPKFSSMITTGCQLYNSCLDFCPGACLRTVSVMGGDASFSEDTVMIVQDNLTGQDVITINRDVRGFPDPEPISNRFSDAYTVVLPKGSFTIRFESISSPGTIVWPGYAFLVFESAPTSCTDYVVESDVTFEKPAANRPECDELIHNGNFDSGNGWEIEGWNGFHFAVQHKSTSGIGGSGALATTQSTSSGNWPTQVLDAPCLEAGKDYEVQVSYKIVDGSHTEIQQNLSDIDSLPAARIFSQVYDTSDPSNKRTAHDRWTDVAWTSADSPSSGWRTMSSIWTVSDSDAMADIIKFHIHGSPDQLLINDVSVRRVLDITRRRGLRG